MNPLFDMTRIVLYNGEAYTWAGLLEYCKREESDSAVPIWRREVYAFIALFMDPHGEKIIQKSSGSTGDPKSFILLRESMKVSAERTIRFLNLQRGERTLLSLPIHYIAGKMMVVRALMGGLDLILTEPSSRPLKDMEGVIDFAAMVPLQIEESLSHGDPLGKLSKLIIGGGELHPATRVKLSSMAHTEVYETFGMTETYTHFALRRMNGPDPQSHFRLLEGVQIGVDSRDCLEVEVPGITSGRLVTNDLVEISASGDGFTWRGRFDNLINSGGIKIIPELLEEQIRGCIGQECLVLPESDRRLGQSLVLLVKFEGENPPVEQWVELLRAKLSAYEIPRRIVSAKSLPRTHSMKPDRTSARKLLL